MEIAIGGISVMGTEVLSLNRLILIIFLESFE